MERCRGADIGGETEIDAPPRPLLSDDGECIGDVMGCIKLYGSQKPQPGVSQALSVPGCFPCERETDMRGSPICSVGKMVSRQPNQEISRRIHIIENVSTMLFGLTMLLLLGGDGVRFDRETGRDGDLLLVLLVLLVLKPFPPRELHNSAAQWLFTS